MQKKTSIYQHRLLFDLLVVLIIIFCGCAPQPKNIVSETIKGDFTIKVIDSCEYIEYDYGIFDHRVFSLTHKGNCIFCVERAIK